MRLMGYTVGEVVKRLRNGWGSVVWDAGVMKIGKGGSWVVFPPIFISRD